MLIFIFIFFIASMFLEAQSVENATDNIQVTNFLQYLQKTNSDFFPLKPTFPSILNRFFKDPTLKSADWGLCYKYFV